MIKQRTIQLIKNNPNITQLSNRLNVPLSTWIPIMYDVMTYNTAQSINRYIKEEENITKNMNKIYQQLIKERTILKPKFKPTPYPWNTYKEY